MCQMHYRGMEAALFRTTWKIRPWPAGLTAECGIGAGLLGTGLAEYSSGAAVGAALCALAGDGLFCGAGELCTCCGLTASTSGIDAW